MLLESDPLFELSPLAPSPLFVELAEPPVEPDPVLDCA
jgi:hypothetical protein